MLSKKKEILKQKIAHNYYKKVTKKLGKTVNIHHKINDHAACDRCMWQTSKTQKII